MKQYVMIYSIQYQMLFASQKTKTLLATAFSIFSIKLITACAIENYFEIQIVFYTGFFGHSKIPLAFYA